MTVGELREKLEGIDDNVPVGITDHFGDFEPMLGLWHYPANEHPCEGKEVVCLDIPWIGPEPD